jgi:hypothetical protein
MTKARSVLDGLRKQGFDRSEVVPFERSWRVRCSQCEALCINGIPTHERGCPNSRRRDKDDEEED